MIAAAIPVGFFAGLFGIGGGLISVPFLFFIFETFGIEKDFLMHLTVGTAFSITILTSFSSVITHKKHNAVDLSIIRSFGIFVILGVVTGTVVASVMNTKSLVLFFSIMVYVLGAYLLLAKNKNKKKFPSFNLLHRFSFGFTSGLISAPMGITGAMINVPVLRYFGYPINRAIGSAAAIGFIISLFGAIGFFLSGIYKDVDIPLSIGFVNIPAFLVFVPVTTYMARIGANTVHKLEKAKIQVLFGIFLYVMATIFLYRYFNI
tara:strand:- start:1236 stop:2021 length:786 start_codon:yes stop_codon:yes gene_type:complete